MPIAAAILGAGLIVLLLAAFWLSSWYISQDMAGQLRNTANGVAGWPVVGGGISSAISWIADGFIYLSIRAAKQLDQAITNAAWRLASDLVGVVANIPLPQWVALDFAVRASGDAVYALQTWVPNRIASLRSDTDFAIHAASDAVQSLQTWVPDNFNRIWAQLNWTTGAASDAVRALQTWVPQTFTQVWGTLIAHDGAIRGLQNWQRQEQDYVLPRLQDEVSQRALDRDLQALKDVVNVQAQAITVLWTLAILATAGATAIETLRCVSKLDCSVLSDIADCDVCDRLNNLELAG